MAAIRSFRDLEVDQVARQQAQAVFRTTRSFPREETYSLTDQIRRASRAVGAMIAEGWGRRRYEAVFINKLSDAMGEAMETQSWLDDALDCGYINIAVHGELDARSQQIGAMLQRMIDRADSFCRSAKGKSGRT
jgi:four helix bundle protein